MVGPNLASFFRHRKPCLGIFLGPGRYPPAARRRRNRPGLTKGVFAMLEMKTFLEEAKELEAELVTCRRTLHQTRRMPHHRPRSTIRLA